MCMELSREVIGDMSLDELHAFVQAKGFKRASKVDPDVEEAEAAEATAAADDAQATEEASAKADDTQAAG